ncbi:MAG: hypothetical protein ACYDH1_10920 [Anaerolineaceae bacterium]
MKSKRTILFIFVLVCLTMLSGCVNQIGIPLTISSGIMNAGGPVIDIEINGTKHIAWIEERITGIGLENANVIVYLRTIFGETGIRYQFTPPINYDYTSPDIAVTDNGYVYVVWMKMHKTDPDEIFGCYDIIPPSGSFTPTCHQLSDYAFESYKIVDPPKVAANGNEVYAVYNVPYEIDFHGKRLRYRQLGSILDDYAGWVSTPTIYMDQNYQVAVDSNGKAHVTWLQYNGEDNAVLYNSNVTVDGFNGMNDQRVLASNGNYNNITITGSPSEEVFISYRALEPVYSIRINHCAVSNCVMPISSFTVPLDPTIEPWSAWYLDAGAANNSLYLTFRGRNDLTTGLDYEIFFYAYPSSSSPTRITYNDYEDYDPMIASSDGIPIIAWLSDVGTTYERKIWDSFNGIRTVAVTQMAYSDDGDIAGRGEWVAGVWTDYYSSTDSTNSIWLAFNAHMVDLPLIVK